jgi:hypothetical protein
MSTPSRRTSYSVAPSDHAVGGACERPTVEPEPCESTEAPPLSPYAPKRAHQRADTLPHQVKDDAPSVKLVFDWKRAKEAASEELDASSAVRVRTAGADVFPAGRHEGKGGEQQVLTAVQQAVEAARNAINESPFAVDQLPRDSHPARGPSAARHGVIDRPPTVIDRISGEQLLDPAQTGPLAPPAPPDRPAQEGGERHAKSADDTELENLEASLRWLHRRQAATMRLPPAPKLARSRPAAPDARGDASVGGRTVDPFQASLRSLEPTRIMPPPAGTSRHPNAMLGVFIVCLLTAGIVYYYLEAGRSPSSEAASQLQVASVVPQSTSTMELRRSARPELLPSAPNRDGDHETSSETEISPQPIATAAATITPQQEMMAVRPPTLAAPDPATAPPSAFKPTRTLDPENIALLVNEAQKHIATGDVVTARMIFQRAAEAGDANAALALAATYDPTVLAKLGVMGMGADVEKARAWYRMAESFGSAEAKQRLRSLDRE